MSWPRFLPPIEIILLPKCNFEDEFTEVVGVGLTSDRFDRLGFGAVMKFRRFIQHFGLFRYLSGY